MNFKNKLKKADLTILEESMRPSKNNDVVPEFHASGSSMKQTIKLFEDIFDNMKNRRDTKQFPGVLLAGEPGTGKTTRIQLLSRLLGVNLITIEAPHIIEEHIINIPFIVFNAENGQVKTGSTKLKGDEFKIVLADSNLFSQLKKSDVVPDETHLKNIYKSKERDIIELYEALGGTEDELLPEIAEIRNQFNVILFLDEYFRQTSMRIRNMLRSILNNKIGAHDIPRNVYIVYATNLHDEGVEGEIPQNNEFEMINMENPSKKEWFSWLVFKFENDKHVRLNKSLINKFHHVLENEHISYQDADAEVRTSPRRWEQLLLYINAAIPSIKDEEDAISLMTNVRTNFKNYLTGKHSDIYEKVLQATADLIKEEKGIELNAHAHHTDDKWRKTLQHQIEMKMKLGKNRKYVPIIAGLPGIGKTAQAEQVAKNLDLRFIDIDVSTINAEDVVGLPMAKTTEGGSEGQMETTFSIPSLYKQIMDRIKQSDKEYLDDLKKESPDDFEQKKKEYEDRPYKYLIFFDELNRNSSKVFNAIRRILLEKNFGPSGDGKGKLLELPHSAIMLGAINPHDAGAQELTHHMRDVLDVIDSGANWQHTVEYMEDQKIPSIGDDAKNLSIDILKKFVHKFHTKDPNVDMHKRPYFLDIGTTVYVSPREYVTSYVGLARKIDRELKKIHKQDLSSLNAQELAQIEDDLRESIFEGLIKSTGFTFVKHGLHGENQEFIQDLKTWVMNSPDIDLGENLFYKKALDTKKNSLMDIVGEHFDGLETIHAHEHDDFINFMDNVDLTKFREDLTDLAASRIVDEASAKKYILDDTVAIKEYKDGDIVKGNEKVCLVENFMREIVLSLYISEQPWDRINTVAKGVYEALKQYRAKNIDVIDEDLMDEIVTKLVEIRANIMTLVNDLK